MGLFLARESARKSATTGQTQDERARRWCQWVLFLDELEYHDDPFLQRFEEQWCRTLILAAFAQAMREASFSHDSFDTLAEGTIRAAVDNVAQNFRANNRPDPRVDDGGRLHHILQQQYKGYKNMDKHQVQQKALPLIVLRKLFENKSTVENIATAQLCIGAIFFAMCSCKYLKSSVAEEKRKTQTLRIPNLRFYKKGRILKHSDPCLALTDTITITFEEQKNGEYHESVTMHRSRDTVLCPVRAWASIARRVLSYPDCNENSPVNTIFVEGKIATISSATVRVKLRSEAKKVGVDRLGFEPEDIETHSIRSGAAMTMYLAGVPTFTIMMIGRWSSDAFLRYIRKQVE